MMHNNTLEQAYQHCMQVARSHYENFPVASWLLPAHLRRATTVIYAFARRGDDIVDEGNADAATRHAELQIMWAALDDIAVKKPPADPLFIALADVIADFNIPLHHFYDLLTAFRFDIDTHHYATSAEVHNYCQYSANPIGRLILHLHRQAKPDNLCLSDKVCTALQLLNFIQDLGSDWQQRQRCYLPLDEMQAFGINFEDLTSHRNDLQMQQLIQQQLRRVRQLLAAGAPLAQALSGRLGWELRAIIASAWQLADKLGRRTNVYHRPTLRAGDGIGILFLMLFYTKRICVKPPIKSLV